MTHTLFLHTSRRQGFIISLDIGNYFLFVHLKSNLQCLSLVINFLCGFKQEYYINTVCVHVITVVERMSEPLQNANQKAQLVSFI